MTTPSTEGPPPADDLVPLAVVAAELLTSPYRLRRLPKSRRFPVVRIDGELVVSQSELDGWLERSFYSNEVRRAFTAAALEGAVRPHRRKPAGVANEPPRTTLSDEERRAARDFLTLDAIAKQLLFPAWKLRAMARRDDFPVILQLGRGHGLVRRADYEAWKESRWSTAQQALAEVRIRRALAKQPPARRRARRC